MLCGSAGTLWVLSVMAFFLSRLYGVTGGRYPELVFLGHLFIASAYAFASALAGGFLLAILIAVLNETGFFAPWPRNLLRPWTLLVMLFTGTTVAGICLVIAML